MMASYAMMLARISVGYSIGSSRSRISIRYAHQDAAEGSEALAKEIFGNPGLLRRWFLERQLPRDRVRRSKEDDRFRPDSAGVTA